MKFFFEIMNLTNFTDQRFKNDSSGYHEEIGGLLYFLLYISDLLPYSVLSGFGVCAGILGWKLKFFISTD